LKVFGRPIALGLAEIAWLAVGRGLLCDRPCQSETLADKRDDEALTEAEYAELLDLSNQVEWFGVTRVDALAKLATICQVPLLKLMDSLGIQSPGSWGPGVR
jgi:hypothetical protein